MIISHRNVRDTDRELKKHLKILNKLFQKDRERELFTLFGNNNKKLLLNWFMEYPLDNSSQRLINMRYFFPFMFRLPLK